MRTRELHGPGYYHVGSPADAGYAEQIRFMYSRDELDPPRRDPPTSGSFSQGTSSQSSQRAAWQSRPGQNVPAFSGSRIVLTRGIDSKATAYRRTSQTAYEDDFGEHGGSPYDSIYPSVAAPWCWEILSTMRRSTCYSISSIQQRQHDVIPSLAIGQWTGMSQPSSKLSKKFIPCRLSTDTWTWDRDGNKLSTGPLAGSGAKGLHR